MEFKRELTVFFFLSFFLRFVDGDSTLPEEVLPEWIVVGESVLIRPYNSSGVISFIGCTEFASGTWIGVELDTPTGKCGGGGALVVTWLMYTF